MDNFNISIFGNKTFLEIITEIKLFSNFRIKYYDNLDKCLADAEKQDSLAVLFIDNKNKFFDNIQTNNLPLVLITEPSAPKIMFSSELIEQLNKPFAILEFQKKIISLIAKNKFKSNSLIKLNNYTLNKNERKIKKHDIELQLSEKEINFLVLFSKTSNPVSKKIVLKKVWNYSEDTETHTVETHIHRLRKKILKKFGDNNFIKNSDKGYYI